MTKDEAIKIARTKRARKEFQFEIKERNSYDINVDKAELACGHHTYLHHRLSANDTTAECTECIKNWIKDNSKDSKPED